MSAVTMRHPDLPGQEIEVPDSAVPHHRAAGWQVVDPALSPPSEAQPSDDPPSKRRARRASKESE